jgi:NAD(P)-dependent dehydrogenase (short-subunit alcohol dehydrogenase family)
VHRHLEEQQSMQLSMEGKRILITAGAGGIGRVMAQTFVSAGARVHICDVVPSAIDETVKSLEVTATRCDVSNLQQVDQLFAETAKALGGLDVLINNAGIAGPTGRVEELAVEDWLRCIDVDLNGMF